MRRTTTTGESSTGEHGAASRPRHAGMRVPLALLVIVAVALVGAGFALGRVALSASAGRMERVDGPTVQVGAGQANAGTASLVASASSGMVEVPRLTGMRADEAAVVLETAGFKVAFVDEGLAVASEASRVVQSQQPAPGTVLSVDTTVSITVPPLSAVATTVTAGAKESKPKFVVCIDPGHQAYADGKLEPIGPGARTEKPRASGGSTGVTTGVPEYELALQISMNLKRRLEAAGVKVIMTRTTNDVGLPNSARAMIANRAKADLFLRIHGGLSTNPEDSGITTFYPSKNHWTAKIVPASRRAAQAVEHAVCLATGAANRGACAQSGVAGFNWSQVPTVLVEAGYLSNPVEDRLLSGPNYQDQLAQGITDGVLVYLNGARR